MLLVYLKNEEKSKDIINLNIYEKSDLLEEKKEDNKKENINFIKKSKQCTIKENIKSQIEWKYPYKKAINLPTMITVSKIKELETQNKVEQIHTLKKSTEKASKQEKKVPEFLKEGVKISGARMGTLVHLCLQNLNEKEEYNLEKIENLIASLANKKIIAQSEAKAINRDSILQYTKSNLFKELNQAKEIHKEAPFYFDISSKEIINEDIDEKILVQGIIDLYYIDKNDNMILVDYKTDFVKREEELVEKYIKQLEVYKRALEEATERKTYKIYIYSIYLQKAIEII